MKDRNKQTKNINKFKVKLIRLCVTVNAPWHAGAPRMKGLERDEEPDESCFWGLQLNIYVFENVLAFHHIWFIKTPYSLASGHASF